LTGGYPYSRLVIPCINGTVPPLSSATNASYIDNGSLHRRFADIFYPLSTFPAKQYILFTDLPRSDSFIPRLASKAINIVLGFCFEPVSLIPPVTV
jgi:hypothetical protein